MEDGQGNAKVETNYGVHVHETWAGRGKKEPDPERGNGGGIVGDEAHLNEQLTRRRHARYAAIGFIIATWILLTGVIISIVCLLYRLFGVYTADQVVSASPEASASGDASEAAGTAATAAATQLADISVVTHVLPALPIFSLSLFALLVYITLARFTKNFVSESTARESAQEDMSDDSVILAALDKVSQLFKQSRK